MSTSLSSPGFTGRPNGPHFYPRLSRGQKGNKEVVQKIPTAPLIFFDQPIPASPLLCGPQVLDYRSNRSSLPSQPTGRGPHRPLCPSPFCLLLKVSAGLCWSLPIWSLGQTSSLLLRAGKIHPKKLALHFSFSKAVAS